MKIWISTNRKQLMEFLKCVCLLCNSHACQTAENPVVGNPKTNKAFRHARGVADINQMPLPSLPPISTHQETNSTCTTNSTCPTTLHIKQNQCGICFTFFALSTLRGLRFRHEQLPLKRVSHFTQFPEANTKVNYSL